MGTALNKSAHALLRAYKPPARACGLLVLSDAVKSLFKLGDPAESRMFG